MSNSPFGSFYPIPVDDLPSAWSVRNIGSVITDVQSGFASGVHNKDGVGIPHLRPMNVSREGSLDLADIKYVSPNVNSLRAVRGDVLFNNTNSPELIGKTAAIRSPIKEMAFSNHMTRLRPPKGLNHAFVAHQLHFLWMTGYFRHRCTNHVNQASISSSALAETVPLVIAPPEEQNLIVAAIDKQFTRLDAATTALKRAQDNLKRYRASVLKAACEGRLVPTEAELARKEGRGYELAEKLLERILKERRARWEDDQLAKMIAAGKPPKDDRWKLKYKQPQPPDMSMVPDLPEGWICTRLDTIADVIDPNPSHRTPEYVEDGVAFVSAENFVGDSMIDFTIGRQVGQEVLREQGARFPILEGAFAMSRYGTVGKTCKLPPDRTYCLSYSLVVIQSTTRLVDSDFLRLVCSSSLIMTLAQSRIQGATIPDLGVAHIRSLPIAIPTRSEQRRITEEAGRKLSVVDQLTDTVTQELLRADRLRQSILKRAFEGKLVPQDSNDEPAAELLKRTRADRNPAASEKRGRRSRTEFVHA